MREETMEIGVIVPLRANMEHEFEKVHAMDIRSCQLNGWHRELFTETHARQVRKLADRYGIEISAFWCGWEGPAVWNFLSGPATLGIVPVAYRHERMNMLCQGADFAKWLGTPDMITHLGFVPENPGDPAYRDVVEAVAHIGRRCLANGIHFLFETGQETPVTLRRLIEDTGLPNLGINLDPANLMMYGKANPVDAVRIFGTLIRGVHAKDGGYPVNGRELGAEKPLGQGEVQVDRLIAALRKIGYRGALTIEREIDGEEQIQDIRNAKALLERLAES
jgi:sugar phosphate isomerase/epimerase